VERRRAGISAHRLRPGALAATAPGRRSELESGSSTVGEVSLLEGDRSTSPPAQVELVPPTRSRRSGPEDSHRRIAFGWYGGKYSHLNWLLPLLPDCHHYVEPFGGSAAVLLNRAPSPLETYNDLDGEVVNFFRVLRSDREALLRSIVLTPFSREEYLSALAQPGPAESELERARRFFVRARQARTGLAQKATQGRWATCRTTSRAGMAGAVSRWLGSVETLPEIADRLLRVQIENRPALEVIERYDSEGTLLYCDPPYVASTRGDPSSYGYEMSEADHARLAGALRSCRGRVAVSGYRCDLMDELYRGWTRTAGPRKTAHSVKRPRQEFLWTNYPVPRAR
jgi:DNA adenine methylase